MAKTRRHFLCRQCGSVQRQWMGKCPDCGAWDSLETFTEPAEPAATSPAGLAEGWRGAEGPAADATVSATPLPRIELDDVPRLQAGIGELDRVLGGGLVAGSVVLLGGDPGIGKSTLLLQAAADLARRQETVLYVTSEESARQTRLRAARLFGSDDAEHSVAHLEHLLVLADTNLARIVEQARRVQPRVCVIDSIQMVYQGELTASPGSIAQLRRCCMELVYLAKVSGMAIVLIGHITKDGQLAGPKLLEHLVDVVLSFEGDRHHAHRVVRSIKNRYGTTLEVGLFEMTGRGLAEVRDPAALLDPAATPHGGSVVCPVMHGSRCLMVEVQALTCPGILGSAKRKSTGLDASRLAVLIAVLEKHGGLRLADQDVFASAVGGLKIIEPAADLALCLAIAGAHLGRTLPAATAVVGEIGLGGEVRAAPQLERRVREVARLGYRTLVTAPGGTVGGAAGTRAEPVATIDQALQWLDAAEPVKRSAQPEAVEA